MHFLDPVAEAVHDHPPNNRVVRVEGVSAAGVVGVPRAATFEDVVSRIIDAAEAEHRPGVIALRGVVVHHVENDLDARTVQRLDHISKFVHGTERILTRAVRLVRSEERDRRIAPVVDLSRGTILSVELEHRQQLHGGDAKLLEIRNLLDQTLVSAARLLSDSGAWMAREAAHVHLVDDGARGRQAQRCISLPIVNARIDDHALHRRCAVVAGALRSLAVIVLRNHHPSPIRIEQHLAGIEPQSSLGAPMVLGHDNHKAAPAAHPARMCASSGRYDWSQDRFAERALVWHHPRDRRARVPRWRRFARTD